VYTAGDFGVDDTGAIKISWGGDFDLFGSSLVYLVPRALVVEYIGPLYSKGALLLCHKDNAERFKTAADLNKADVTFSVTSGASEEPRIPLLLPAKSKVIATTGQVSLSAEPVRAKGPMCGSVGTAT
jgi:polar amino acid transport system substrate-binding protein